MGCGTSQVEVVVNEEVSRKGQGDNDPHFQRDSTSLSTAGLIPSGREISFMSPGDMQNLAAVVNRKQTPCLALPCLALLHIFALPSAGRVAQGTIYKKTRSVVKDDRLTFPFLFLQEWYKASRLQHLTKQVQLILCRIMLHFPLTTLTRRESTDSETIVSTN